MFHFISNHFNPFQNISIMADKTKTVQELEKELAESVQREAEVQERLQDLKAKQELEAKSVIQKKVLVKVDKKTYEILGNARVGGLGKGETYTKEDLQKPENLEILKTMIAKGSGLLQEV